MAFGIPNSDGGGAGGNKFLGRIQFDARSGAWLIVKRIQHDDSSYGDAKGQPFMVSEERPLQLLMDFGSLDVGYIKLTSPPSFLVVPYGQPVPVQPEEMAAGNKPGDKPRKAFLPGFRIQVAGSKTFGDQDAYYFSGTSKTLLSPMDALHQEFLRAPEAAGGMIPMVKVERCTSVETKTPQGTTTFWGPEFQIVSWLPRPAVFGERTVPNPTAGARTSAPVAAPVQPPRAASHVPPPTPKAAPARELADAEVPF